MVNIDWSKLSFSYTQTKALVFSRCIDGAWEKPVVTEDFNIPLSSFAGIFHYAPSCFEGLKAFRGVDNKIRLFRLSSWTLLGLWIILFVLVSFLPIDPLYRFFSIMLVFPVFERMDLKNNERLKTMRSMSIILYMVQFMLIWLYKGACNKIGTPLRKIFRNVRPGFCIRILTASRNGKRKGSTETECTVKARCKTRCKIWRTDGRSESG